MVVVCSHGLLHHPEDFRVLSAESHFSLVVEHEFVRCARTSDGTDLPVDAHLCKFPLPIIRIRDQGSVFKIDEAFRYGKHRHGRIEMSKHLGQEPVHSERRHASDDEICAIDRCLPIFEMIILNSLWERDVKLRMLVVFQTSVDDVPVKRSSDKTDFIAVLKSRISKG